MRSRWNLLVYVCYVAVCLAVAGFIVRGIGVRAPWQHVDSVVATFHSGDGILANNEVFLNGVKVGRVKSVDAAAGQARVTMTLEESGMTLYNDSQAVVRKKNLLGETYIELVRGSRASGTMEASADGSRVIPSSRTTSPVDIDQVLAILDPTTRDRVKLLINGAGDGLANRGQDLNAEAVSFGTVATTLQTPANRLSVRQQQIENIVLELQRLYDMLAKQRDQVSTEMGTFSDVLQQLADQETAVTGTLTQADTLLNSVGNVLSGQVPALRQSIQSLPSTLTAAQQFLSGASNTFTAIAPYRRSIHDVFPDLNYTFSDTDPNSPVDPITGDHQHYWSVYSLNCFGQANPSAGCSAQHTATAPTPAGPNTTWTAVLGGV